jgi:PAS domain S-box-containing protein
MPKAKLMIVEDEWVIADDLRVCLERMEYEVLSVVTRGEEAVKKAEEERPDLIIMDIMLSGDMSGIEAAGQIRTRFHIPQIYVTAYADDHMLEKAKITEPLGYLIKPFDDKELHAVIEMALYKSKMEKQLRESEEKYRRFFTTVPSGWAFHKIIVDENGKPVDYIFLEVNAAFEKLTGLKKENIIGKRITEVLPGTEKDPADWIGKYGEVALTGNTLQCENYSEAAGRWFSISASSPEQGYFIVVLDDITEKKQAEEALRESEERFQGAFDSAAIGISLVSPEGRWLKVNEALCDIVGYSEEELLAHSFQDITHPEDLNADLAYVKQMLAGNIRHFHMEKRYIHKEGHLVWVLLSVSLVWDNEGNPLYFVSQVQDITGRKMAERELAQRSELAELGADIGSALTKGKTLRDTLKLCCDEFVQHLDVAFARIWTVNKADNMLELQASSGMYSHIDGAHSRIPVGVYKIGIIAQKRQPHLSNNILEDPQISDREWAKREGMKSFAGHPLMIKDRVVGVMGMFSRNHLELITLKVLSSVADELAIGIERLRSEEELQRVNAELEHKSREMEQLVHVTSHDLRTPLAIVQGYCKELEITISEILAEVEGECVSSDMQKRLDPHFKDIRDTNKYIQSNVRKMDALLHGLLKLSRSGNVELAIEPLDMHELISDVHTSLALKMREAGVKVEISDLPSCLGDRNQINQVFSNLLGNALKYLDPDRPGVITISGHREEREVLYCVEDNGIGIASTDKDRIFNIFYQGNSQAKGEGLGLTIVRRIVERHGGRVWVESSPGTGSRFFVALPVDGAGQEESGKQ